MGNLPALFKLHSVAEAYGRRPSEILHVADEWAAYQLDAAASLLGKIVRAALVKGDDVSALLDGQPGRPAPQRFRSPAGAVLRLGRMRIGGLPGGAWPAELLPDAGGEDKRR